MDATAYWRGRAKTYAEEFPDRPSWTAHYWASWKMPHRLEILKVLEGLEGDPPLHSLLEVGCNVGPNLRLWRERWPDRVLLGCDVSPEAIQAAQAYFGDDKWVYLWRDDVVTSPWLPMADVLVSCYSLAYVTPQQMPAVVQKIWRSARRAVVLAEPMVVEGDADVLAAAPMAVEVSEAGEVEVIEDTPTTYRHNYASLFAALGAVVSVVEIPEADKLNGIMTARRV